MNLDIGSILLAALIGGAFGGLGGYVGHLIGKQVPAHAKLITQVVTAASVAMGVLLTDPIKRVFAPGSFPERSIAEVDAELLQSSRLLWVIKSGWPSEYQAFIERIAGATEQAVANQMAIEFTAGLRRADAAYIQFADDRALVNVLITNAALTRAIQMVDGDAACAAFGATGPSMLGDRATHFTKELEDASLAVFDALQSGRSLSGTRPALPPPALAQADLYALDQFIIARGGKPALWEQVLAPDNPDLCSDGLDWLDAVAEFDRDGPRGRAIRVTSVYGMAAM